MLISSPQDLHQFRIMGAAIKRRRVHHSGCLQIDIYLCCLEVVGFFLFRFLTLGIYETRALINSGQHEEETNSYIFKKIKKSKNCEDTKTKTTLECFLRLFFWRLLIARVSTEAG